MKEGTKISNHFNPFNSLFCELYSIDVKLEWEDKEITLVYYLPESWDHFVNSISFSSTDTIEFDAFVGALLSKKTQWKSSLETSTSEAMVVIGRSKEKEQNSRDTSRSKSRGKKNKLKCWYCLKSVTRFDFHNEM